MTLCVIERRGCNVERLLISRAREEFSAGLLRHRLQLFDSRRAVDVSGNRENLLLLIADQPAGEFAGSRRFTGTLKTGEQDDRGRRAGEIDLALLLGQIAADHSRQLTLHDAHENLARVQASDHFLAERLFLDAVREFTHDRQCDVGLQQRQPHLAEHLLRVFFRNAGLTPHGLHNFG